MPRNPEWRVQKRIRWRESVSSAVRARVCSMVARGVTDVGTIAVRLGIHTSVVNRVIEELRQPQHP